MEPAVSLVLGASEKPDRYSNSAVKLLRALGHSVYAYGQKEGKIGDTTIQTKWPENIPIDTVTLYLNPLAQREYANAILALRPRRLVFNPGTENDDLAVAARAAGIQTLEACTLVLLRTGQY